MNSPKNATLLAAAALSTVAVLAMPANAEVLVAGWDTFTAEPERNSPATVVGADTTVTMSGTGNWGDWNGGGTEDGASPDGTFGNLSNAVAAASTFIGTGSSQNTNLSLGRNDKPGTLVFTLVNDSGLDRTFEAFYFDGAARFSQSARDWEMTFSDAISGTAVSRSLTENADGMSGVAAADRDHKIDLSGTSLSDNIWEAGSTAVFTLSFTGGANSSNTGTNGGHETLIDNIGITIAPIPEPSSLALLALGGLAMVRRRRSA